MTESLEIDPFNSNRMMYGTGATIYGTEQPRPAGTPAASSPSSRWSQGLEETAVLDLVSPPSGAAAAQRARRHRRLPAHRPRRGAAMMFTSPNFTTTTSLDFAETNPSTVVRVGNRRLAARARRVLHRRRRQLVPGHRAGRRHRRRHGRRGGRRQPVRLEPGRRAAVHYATGFGNSWTASQRHPGRRGRRVRPGRTRRSSTASSPASSTSAPTAARPSPPPPRPGCRADSVRFKARARARRATSGSRAARRRRVRAVALHRLRRDLHQAAAASSRPTRSASARRRRARRTRRSTPARRSAAYAASSAPTTRARPGCGSTTTRTSTAGPAPPSPATRGSTAGSTSARTAAGSCAETSRSGLDQHTVNTGGPGGTNAGPGPSAVP